MNGKPFIGTLDCQYDTTGAVWNCNGTEFTVLAYDAVNFDWVLIGETEFSWARLLWNNKDAVVSGAMKEMIMALLGKEGYDMSDDDYWYPDNSNCTQPVE